MQKMKRCFDIIFSLLCMIVFSPLWLTVTLVVSCNVKGSILFCQPRVGRDGKVFRIVKFRTVDHPGTTGADHISRAAAFLRTYKLDEAAQLWNILRGDMSFVGPRPYILSESAGLPKERFAMRPGLTGLAQIRGNTKLSWEERTAYDLAYIANWNVGLDIWILAATPGAVLKGEQACLKRPGSRCNTSVRRGH